VRFRRGLAVVELSFYDGPEPLAPDRVDALLPIAQAIDARLVGQRSRAAAAIVLTT
jgi:hypothetical protein